MDDGTFDLRFTTKLIPASKIGSNGRIIIQALNIISELKKVAIPTREYSIIS